MGTTGALVPFLPQGLTVALIRGLGRNLGLAVAAIPTGRTMLQPGQSHGPERHVMITTAVLDQIGDRISAGTPVDEAAETLSRRHRLTRDQSAAIWLLARREAEDPGRREREQRARTLLRPID
jgi:hypothetical protein